MTRHEGQLRQGQLDTALANLQRKREKKRHYKVALLEETAQLQAALVHKDVRIGELNHRIDKVTWLLPNVTSCLPLISTLVDPGGIAFYCSLSV